jgi:hypothetical protein
MIGVAYKLFPVVSCNPALNENIILLTLFDILLN